MRSHILFLILPTLALVSCIKCIEPIPNERLQVTLKNTDSYTYSTEISGDEEGALIKSQATRFEVSELRRDSTTHFNVIYFYKPKQGFVGIDSVEIEKYQGSNGASPSNDITTVKILMNIIE